MSTSRDDLPTTVIAQQTVEQPSVTASPETRWTRIWHHRLPAHIGRARTSTLVIGALFVLLGGLNFVLPRADPFVVVPTSDGGTVRVRESQYTPPPATPSTTAPAAPSAPPSSSAPTGSGTPSTADDEDGEEEEGTTAPPTTSPTTGPPTSSPSRATTGRTSSTTAAPEETADERTPEGTADPTG